MSSYSDLGKVLTKFLEEKRPDLKGKFKVKVEPATEIGAPLKCPKCGNTWIADRALTMEITKSISGSEQLKKRDKPRWHCIKCKHEWDESS